MHTIQRTIEIKAPIERVFEFITQPNNLPRVWPSLVSVSNVVTKPGGYFEYDSIYKMAGVHLKLHTKTEDAQPNKLLRVRTEGGIEATFRWTFRGLDGTGSKVTCEVEYTIPVPVLGKVAEVLVMKLNEREMDITFANIKDALEHAGAKVAVGATASH
ncbi:MAG: SRPBCC family protein [Polyangiales bacterium]